MIRRVVFAGGLQAKALAKAYRLDIAAERDEDVFFIPTEAMAREAAHRVIAAADLLVSEIGEAGPVVPDGLLPASAQRVDVPVVLADFLWPFAGAAHPRNAGTAALKDGPYPVGFGDSFLDHQAAEGVPEDVAIERYLALDVSNMVDLDRLYRHRMAVLAELDRLTGCEVAPFVAEEFRSLNLFASLDRLRLPLFRPIAASVFSRMGIEPLRAASLLEAPFPAGAMPIHPSVLRYFNMEVPRFDHRYAVLDEGFFTFEQYCRRYLRYEWNEELHTGIALADSNPAEAVPMLQAALERSPGSRAGQRALEDAERVLREQTRQSAPLSLPSAQPNSAQPNSAQPNSAQPNSAQPSPAQPTQTTPAQAPWRGTASSAMPFHPPEAVPSPTAASPSPATQEEPQFAATGFSGLRFTPARPDAATPRTQSESAMVTLVSPPATGAVAAEPAGSVVPPVPAPQSYVELPLGPMGNDPPPLLPAPAHGLQPGKYVPLPPDQDLIEVLPRMLRGTRGFTSLIDLPFSAMPETIPPPPLRPVLPPELHAEPVKRGVLARLFGRAD